MSINFQYWYQLLTPVSRIDILVSVLLLITNTSNLILIPVFGIWGIPRSIAFWTVFCDAEKRIERKGTEEEEEEEMRLLG